MTTRKSAIILGIGFFLCAGIPARAQLGDIGDAAKKGATDAAEQELMKKAGLPTPGAPAAAPAADTGAANAPAGAPKAAAGADTGAPPAPDGE